MKKGGEIDIKQLLEDLFLREKPTKILIELKNSSNSYATSVSKAVDCTYSHTTKVLDELEDLNLVEFEKKGRIKRIRLTPHGEDIAHDLEGLTRKFLRLKDTLLEEDEPEPPKRDPEPVEENRPIEPEDVPEDE